jgi:hypothetical protein
MILEKLVSAGIGDRPVVFVTHRSESLMVSDNRYFPFANLFVLFSDYTGWFVNC